MSMQVRFKPDPIFVKGFPLLLGIIPLLMVAFSLLTGFRIAQIIVLVIVEFFAFLIWLGLSRGSYDIVDDEYISGRVFFFPIRATRIADIVSLHRVSIFAGLPGWGVDMIVREKDGSLKQRGLVAWLNESDLKKFIETIHSKNPNIEIDPNIFRK